MPIVKAAQAKIKSPEAKVVSQNIAKPPIPNFARPESRKNQSTLSSAPQRLEEEEETALLQCVNNNAPCSDTAPAIMLTEEMDMSRYWSLYGWGLPSGFTFNVICSGQNCWQRDIYYSVSFIDEWSRWSGGDPASVSAYAWAGTHNMVSNTQVDFPYLATGKKYYRACGTGNAGTCELSTAGVIGSYLFDGNGFWVAAGIHDGSLNGGFIEHARVVVQVSLDPTLLDNKIPDESTFCYSCSPYSNATGHAGNNLNTHTGSMSYSGNGLSVETSAGILDFHPIYISLANDRYSSPLSQGWTHDQDIRLIFSTDPAGMAGFLLFKDQSGNLYRFWDHGDGRYKPYAGLTSTLLKNGGDPITYTLIDQNHNHYNFDERGYIQTLSDAQGRTIYYTYDTNDRLEKVSADQGTRSLEFSYDQQDRLANVTDNSDRQVSFAYDASGDLSTIEDVLGQEWHYIYDSHHRLIEIKDPELDVQQRFEYARSEA